MDILTQNHSDPRDHPMIDRDEPDAGSIARAKDAQETERAEAIAKLLANFAGIDRLDLEPDHIRQRFGMWGLLAVRGSALGAEQFRLVGLALHAAAQAGHDLEAATEHFSASDLLSASHAQERKWWTQLASRIVDVYLNVMGGQTTAMTQLLYSARLYAVNGGRHASRS